MRLPDDVELTYEAMVNEVHVLILATIEARFRIGFLVQMAVDRGYDLEKFAADVTSSAPRRNSSGHPVGADGHILPWTKSGLLTYRDVSIFWDSFRHPDLSWGDYKWVASISKEDREGIRYSLQKGRSFEESLRPYRRRQSEIEDMERQWAERRKADEERSRDEFKRRRELRAREVWASFADVSVDLQAVIDGLTQREELGFVLPAYLKAPLLEQIERLRVVTENLSVTFEVDPETEEAIQSDGLESSNDSIIINEAMMGTEDLPLDRSTWGLSEKFANSPGMDLLRSLVEGA